MKTITDAPTIVRFLPTTKNRFLTNTRSLHHWVGRDSCVLIKTQDEKKINYETKMNHDRNLILYYTQHFQYKDV